MRACARAWEAGSGLLPELAGRDEDHGAGPAGPRTGAGEGGLESADAVEEREEEGEGLAGAGEGREAKGRRGWEGWRRESGGRRGEGWRGVARGGEVGAMCVVCVCVVGAWRAGSGPIRSTQGFSCCKVAVLGLARAIYKIVCI